LFMKSKIIISILTLFITTAFIACKEKIVSTKPANMNFAFKVMSGTTPVTLNTGTEYILDNGIKYSASMIKFYINNVRLVNAAGGVVEAKNYTLLDFDGGKTSYTFEGVPAGDYKSIQFNVGVDYARNHSGAQDGDLDPVTGMIWSWNTGYIFFKHEGQFINSAKATQSLIYHYGTDKAYIEDISLPITEVLQVNGVAKTATIALDLNKLYKGLDFNIDNNRQSGSAADITWLNTLRANFPSSFKLKSIN
jgi:hypothetical protein